MAYGHNSLSCGPWPQFNELSIFEKKLLFLTAVKSIDVGVPRRQPRVVREQHLHRDTRRSGGAAAALPSSVDIHRATEGPAAAAVEHSVDLNCMIRRL